MPAMMVMAGASVLTGLYSAHQQGEAMKAGQASQAGALAVQQEQLQLSREQMQADAYRYQEFKNLYGDIEQNIADYYTNLSPDVYTSQMNSAITNQFNTASTQLRQQMALRGITGSGVEANNMTNLYAQKATAEATAEANAPAWVAQQQQSVFSNQAMPQQNTLMNNMNQSNANMLNSFGGVSNQMNNMANTQFNLAGQYGQSAVSGIGSGMYALGQMYKPAAAPGTAPTSPTPAAQAGVFA
jgi:hypothetical protein